MGQGPVRCRVFVEDARKDGTFLRITWHAEAGQFVVSTWNDEVCTGAVRVPAAEAAPLISLLADGLADAAARPLTGEEPARSTGRFDRLRAWLQQWRPAKPTPGPVELHSVEDTRRTA